MASKVAAKKTGANDETKAQKKKVSSSVKKAAKARRKHLVIVESPAKAKTLKKFLGSAYKIEASMGHVRDLPKSEMGVDIDNYFEPKYITIRGKGELLSKLRKQAKGSDIVYLATDPDREGEAISWHLMHALRLDEQKASRITFNEITKNAVKKSIKEARNIDMALVDAQQARRVLDRIVGYKLSPLLWHKVKKGLSAGRVQSVTLRIICDREEEISNFTPVEYWSIEAGLATANGQVFRAKYPREKTINNKDEADSIVNTCKTNTFNVDEVKKGSRVKKPHPPFTTSTLQQEASKQLGFAASKTMMVAQQLYEGVDIEGESTVGLVSYIRTDSVRISDEAFEEAKGFINQTYGEAYSNAEKPEYKSRGRSQDAHEAIRPTYVKYTPASIQKSLTKDQYKLYNLIWVRFMSSQMMPAVYDTISVKINCGGIIFRAGGSILKFDGYKILYGKDDDDKHDLATIPELNAGDILTLENAYSEQHFTQPPPRFSEAMLVKMLEENGVGRPSTYAPTITTIVTRNYVTKENKLFYPTELGEIVNDIMKNHFEEIIDIDFTAKVEQNLDKVEEGAMKWKDVINQFYYPLDLKVKEAEEKIGEFEIRDEESDVTCDLCGRQMVIKLGRFGKFLACPGFPECRNAKPFFENAGVPCPICEGKVLIKKTKKGRKYYGCENNPECGFMSWNKPTGKKCPDCGAYLIEKNSKNKIVCCSNIECGYFNEITE